MNHTPEAVAYHEAGHAVIALAMRISVEHATIRKMGESLGHVMPHLSLDDLFDEVLPYSGRKEIIFDLAGPVAECMLLRCKEDELFNFPEVSEAYEKCRTGVADGVECNKLFAHYIRQANRILLRRWREVELIARSLISRNQLSGQQIRWLISHCPRTGVICEGCGSWLKDQRELTGHYLGMHKFVMERPRHD